MKKMSNKQLAAEIAGWYGASAILAAYALVSFGVIVGEGLIFQLLNLTGAIGVITISIYKRVSQSIFLNVVWTIVAIIAIANILFNSL